MQGYLRINPNTPAYNNEEKTLHNEIMYKWSAQHNDILLITGHTHQPVFKSLTILESLYKQMQVAKRDNNEKAEGEIEKEIRKREREFSSVSVDYLTMKPSYFNSGCCCYSDGDITGLEIENGFIRLIKWKTENKNVCRYVLEEVTLAELVKEL